MKQWKRLIVGAAVTIGLTSGCKKPLYMDPGDHAAAMKYILPSDLETSPSAALVIPSDATPVPPTVLDPDRPPRYLTLGEGFALALEQGRLGVTNLRGLTIGSAGAQQFLNDDLGSFNGQSFAGDDAIRTFAIDPAIFAANIEASLSKFDTRWLSNVTWSKRDDAVANSVSSLQNGDFSTVNTGFYKPLPTGGLAGITFENSYSRLAVGANQTTFAVINPSYRPTVTVQVEQPLLQNYGVEINQLLQAHPGSTQIAGLRPSGGTRVDGILITRTRYDQQKLQFERQVNQMVLNVESAYWNLYAAYFGLYASEQGLRQAFKTWQLTSELIKAGVRPAQDESEARAQFHRFRADRNNSLQGVLEAERQLRGLMGLKASDGQRLVPTDAPTLTEYKPEWQSSVAEMMQNRPDLLLAQQEVKLRQFDLVLQKNGLRPDLRGFANYNVGGIGTQLDGSGNIADGNGRGNAFASLADNTFNTWNIGFRLDVPLGTREAHASVRVSRLNLAKSYISLQAQRDKAVLTMTAIYQELERTYEQIKILKARRESLGKQISALVERIAAGKEPQLILLNAQINFADSIRQEHAAIATYNATIAAWQYHKGTLMNFNNIVIADGPLPQLAMTRAAEYERLKATGIVLRERESILISPTSPEGVPVMPATANPLSVQGAFERDRSPLPTSLPDDNKSLSTPPPVTAPAPGSTPPTANPERIPAPGYNPLGNTSPDLPTGPGGPSGGPPTRGGNGSLLPPAR